VCEHRGASKNRIDQEVSLRSLRLCANVTIVSMRPMVQHIGHQENFEDELNKADCMSNLEGARQNYIDELNSLRDETDDKYNNMPEGLGSIILYHSLRLSGCSRQLGRIQTGG